MPPAEHQKKIPQCNQQGVGQWAGMSAETESVPLTEVNIKGEAAHLQSCFLVTEPPPLPPWHQRHKVLLLFLSFLVWVLCGFAFYSHYYEWDFVTFFYFAMYTATTVGYGNDLTTTKSGEAVSETVYLEACVFTSLFALFGVIVVMQIIVGAYQWVSARAAAKYRKIAKEAQYKRKAFKALKSVTKTVGSKLRTASSQHSVGKKEGSTSSSEKTEYTKSSDEEEKRKSWWAAFCKQVSIWSPFLFLLLVGLLIGYLETPSWHPIQSIYWTVITVTTIGYGDLMPTGTYGEVIMWFFLPLSVCAAANVFANLAPESIEEKLVKMHDDPATVIQILSRAHNRLLQNSEDKEGVDHREAHQVVVSKSDYVLTPPPRARGHRTPPVLSRPPCPPISHQRLSKC